MANPIQAGNTNLPEIGRYFSTRDLKTINSFNAELLQDIIECIIQLYQISPYDTKTNIYGEAKQETGKTYYSGVNLYALIEHPDTTNREEGFGPDREKSVVFKFHEIECRDVPIYPVIGDIVGWDDQYFEINNVVQEQHLGGIYQKSHSIICNAHLSKLSTLNITERVK